MMIVCMSVLIAVLIVVPITYMTGKNCGDSREFNRGYDKGYDLGHKWGLHEGEYLADMREAKEFGAFRKFLTKRLHEAIEAGFEPDGTTVKRDCKMNGGA